MGASVNGYGMILIVQYSEQFLTLRRDRRSKKVSGWFNPKKIEIEAIDGDRHPFAQVKSGARMFGDRERGVASHSSVTNYV
jgi:hypothetical protein